jgi:nitrite reductase (NADH) large subunit
VIIATGVRSNSYVARLAGLEVGRGVVVDNHLRTSAPDVFAAGDVAEHHGVSYGTWGPSQFQGSIAGMNAVGAASEFAGIPRSNMLKVLGYDMFSIGVVTPEDASYLTVEATAEGNYRYFVLRDSHLVGAILLGDTSLSPVVKKAIETSHDCSAVAAPGTTADDVSGFLKSMA